MATSAPTKHLLLFVSTAICLFVSTSKYGRAHEDHEVGAARVIANDFVPEGGGEGEGKGDEDFPHPGPGEEDPEPIITEALQCFNDRYIYSSCDEEYRLSQNGEVNVPYEHTDKYCKGSCLKETRLVLRCIDQILGHFRFYNKASIRDVRETIDAACGYGPTRGDFNVAKHVRVDDEDIATKLCTSLIYAAVALLIIMGCHLFS